MSYYDEVYLKRINRYGNTIQERLQNKREHDFLVMMQKSPNKVSIKEDLSEKIYEGVLQTKQYDEDSVVDYLLVPNDVKIPMGTVMWVTDIRHGLREFPIMNYAIDPYTTQGYNRYTVIELEEVLYWIKNGVSYKSYCHAAGGGSGARDKNINLKFRMQFSEGGVYLPNKRYSLILPLSAIVDENNKSTKDVESQMLTLKKNNRVTLGRKYDEDGNIRLHGETWRIAGYDMISVDGVVYMTLEEALTDESDDVIIANTGSNDQWFITSNYGQNFSLNQSINDFKIVCYFAGKEAKSKIKINSCDKMIKIKENKDGSYSISKADGAQGEVKFEIGIEDMPRIKQEFLVQINGNDSVVIEGPNSIIEGNTAKYTISNIDESSVINIITNIQEELEKEKNPKVKVNYNLEDHVVEITGLEIGKFNLIIEDTNFEIDIQSIWLGGKY